MQSADYDIIIAGGGLAGLTAALELSRSGFKCLVIEQHKYPFHKVCGEYVSNEIRPYLEQAGFPFEKTGYTNIGRVMLTGVNGRSVESKLKSGGFGLSRYRMDHLLAELVKDAGGKILEGAKITDISRDNKNYIVRLRDGQTNTALLVLGGWGKRSVLDKNTGRKFIEKRSGYMAVKFHIRAGAMYNDMISLHNFPGGYCGAMEVENDQICVAYLTKRNAFLPYKSPDVFEEKVLYQNAFLKKLLCGKSKSNLLTINELYFGSKSQPENGILMNGDAAGLVAPLCGNGMAMAVKSGVYIADIIRKHDHILQSNPEAGRHYLQKKWKNRWRKEFAVRMKAGRALQGIMMRPGVYSAAIFAFNYFPVLLKMLIPLTYGRVLTSNSSR